MIRSEIVTPVVPAVTKIAAAIALPEVRLVVFATRGLGWIIAPVCPTSLIDFETVTCSLNGTPVLHTYTVSFLFRRRSALPLRTHLQFRSEPGRPAGEHALRNVPHRAVHAAARTFPAHHQCFTLLAHRPGAERRLR